MYLEGVARSFDFFGSVNLTRGTWLVLLPKIAQDLEKIIVTDL